MAMFPLKLIFPAEVSAPLTPGGDVFATTAISVLVMLLTEPVETIRFDVHDGVVVGVQ